MFTSSRISFCLNQQEHYIVNCVFLGARYPEAYLILTSVAFVPAFLSRALCRNVLVPLHSNDVMSALPLMMMS